jgi:hypothetical protein
MSPRQNRRRRVERDAAPPQRGLESVERWPDGEWVVRHVTGSATGKSYRCPGCDQQVAGGVGHVVAWPADGLGGAQDRRHWHTPCWQARTRRAVNLQRSRNAPRYG